MKKSVVKNIIIGNQELLMSIKSTKNLKLKIFDKLLVVSKNSNKNE